VKLDGHLSLLRAHTILSEIRLVSIVLIHPPKRGTSTSSSRVLGAVALVVLTDVEISLLVRHATFFASDTMVNNWNRILRVLHDFLFDPGCIIVPK